ncbi:MAG TPA: HyaD/HybD family hydrogenase maturation endopeptidase [Syntrophomonadaceae bacterium]|nr:HyaD/HybD family hydrogenase maturation endopeptidase [Syntrophomonadaceae bacterium]
MSVLISMSTMTDIKPVIQTVDKSESLRHFSIPAQSTYPVYARVADFGHSLTFTSIARSGSVPISSARWMPGTKPVILGLGNPLFQDEGLGIHVIHQLLKEDIAQQAELVDGGTDALALLGVVEEAETLIIIDAINSGHDPGTLQVLKGEEIPLLLSSKISPHQIGFQEVLALANLRGKSPSRIILIGVQPESLDWGTELTPRVAQTIPRIRNMIHELLFSIGNRNDTRSVGIDHGL